MERTSLLEYVNARSDFWIGVGVGVALWFGPKVHFCNNGRVMQQADGIKYTDGSLGLEVRATCHVDIHSYN